MKSKITSALLALVMLAACKKESSPDSTKDSIVRIQDIIADARNFFDINLKNYPSSVDRNLKISDWHQVAKSPIWEKAQIVQDKVKGEIIVVPLKFERRVRFKTNFGDKSSFVLDDQSYLYIYKDASNEYLIKVITFIPSKSTQSHTFELADGYVLEEDWFGNSSNTSFYRNGNIQSLKKTRESFLPTTSSNKSIVECDAVDWYLCDYIDQNGVGTNCQYLFTQYINCHDVGDDGGGGGGDNGGGGGETGYCDASGWVDGVTDASDLVSSTTTSESPETRTKVYVWVFAKGTFNPTLKWKSHETAVHLKENDVWKWQSLTHNSVSREGVIIGGSLQCDVNTATPTVGIYNASMAINYTFTWSFVCNGSPVSGASSKNSVKIFNVND